MGTPRIARARALAAQLTGAGLQATHRASDVAANAPIVLVGPPTLSFELHEGALATWRLLAIAGTTQPETSWEQVDDLVDQLAGQLPVERAEPTAFQAPTGGDPLPAYAVTFTESVNA